MAVMEEGGIKLGSLFGVAIEPETRGYAGHGDFPPKSFEFAKEFHDALSHGSVHEIADFFTEDALYVNPLVHQGPVGYRNFDQGIQIRGLSLIVELLKATVDAIGRDLWAAQLSTSLTGAFTACPSSSTPFR